MAEVVYDVTFRFAPEMRWTLGHQRANISPELGFPARSDSSHGTGETAMKSTIRACAAAAAILPSLPAAGAVTIYNEAIALKWDLSSEEQDECGVQPRDARP
ncbi:MAG: hypothetical protein K8T26_17210 [Lentisphaerae bacterium]|nr:hypothetical protein [Lentisphaerota bacterium]